MTHHDEIVESRKMVIIASLLTTFKGSDIFEAGCVIGIENRTIE